MLLMIDNYDSFTYNLVQYLEELGAKLLVKRNDKITLAELTKLFPQAIIISPGPGAPKDAGLSLEIIKNFAGKIPIFGVCLGHQSIAEAFGGKIVRAKNILHGKTSEIHHDGKGVFNTLASPFTATRYHSLIAEKKTLPKCFEISAWTAEGEIMGIRHKDFSLEGVQFHPESILTLEGKKLLGNFLRSLKSSS